MVQLLSQCIIRFCHSCTTEDVTVVPWALSHPFHGHGKTVSSSVEQVCQHLLSQLFQRIVYSLTISHWGLTQNPLLSPLIWLLTDGRKSSRTRFWWRLWWTGWHTMLFWWLWTENHTGWKKQRNLMSKTDDLKKTQ